MKSETMNVTMLKNKRVREEKANTKIFTWFGNSRLRQCLQAKQARGFHYPSHLSFKFLQLTSKVSIDLYKKRLSLNLLIQVFLTLKFSQI